MIKRIFQVDVFTNEVFGGNPAGVVLEADDLTKEKMQKIAREMNLSETAFLLQESNEDYDYEVKFFTPTEEVDLCGHATIATFYLMAKQGIIRPTNNKVRVWQKTLAGILPVDIVFDGIEVDKIMMTQAKPRHIKTVDNVDEIAKIMNINTSDIGIEDVDDLKLKPMAYSTGLPDIILPIRNEKVLSSLKPDFKSLSYYSKKNEVVGVHAFTMKKGMKDSIFCRNFAPAYGIDEEAATGTANGALSIYLIENRLMRLENNTLDLTIRQGKYMDRPSFIKVTVDNLEEDMKVMVGGEAVIVFEGNIYL